MTTSRPSAKSKLIDAAQLLVRRQGYAATSVDEICTSAGVSKGAFFHHFTSKEALAAAAADQWTAGAEEYIFTLPDWTRIEVEGAGNLDGVADADPIEMHRVRFRRRVA